MKASGGNRLDYNLYLDAARTIVWGDGTNGTATYTATPIDGQVVSIPVYGRIPPRQNVAAGSYGATIRVQLLF
jgi:spore coat protein U-like protein